MYVFIILYIFEITVVFIVWKTKTPYQKLVKHDLIRNKPVYI